MSTYQKSKQLKRVIDNNVLIGHRDVIRFLRDNVHDMKVLLDYHVNTEFTTNYVTVIIKCSYTDILGDKCTADLTLCSIRHDIHF